MDRAVAEAATDPRGVLVGAPAPFGSGLDLCPKLDTSVYPPRPVVGEIAPAGSKAVLESIKQHALFTLNPGQA